MNALSHALLPQTGSTSLIFAAIEGHFEVASLLLQRGANIEAKDGVRINIPWYFIKNMLLSWTASLILSLVIILFPLIIVKNRRMFPFFKLGSLFFPLLSLP